MKQKILAATVFFNVAAVALFAVYAATGNSTVLTFAITALTTAYHFDMRLLAGLITARLAPYYHPDAACFRQRRWEKKLYRFLRVRRWRGKLPTYNPALFDRQTLTPEELADLRAVDETARNAQFFRYWVLKESCMKAVGRGLSLSPQRIAVRLAPQPEAECDALPSPFSLWEGELPGYRLAVCRLGEDAAVRLRVVPVEEIVAGTMKI